MKKPYFVASISTLLALGALTGCGGDGPSSDGRIHIEFWQNTDKSLVSPALEGWADEFNNSEEYNPGLKYYINAKQHGGSYDDLIKETLDKITTDAYPDILYGYPDSFQRLIDRSIVLDFDQFMNSEDPDIALTQAEKDDIFQTYLDEGSNYCGKGNDGKLYSFPFSKSTEVMYCSSVLINADLSKYDPTINNGEKLTTAYLDNLTWDELFEKLCPAIIAHDSDPDVIAAGKQFITPYQGKSAIFAYDSDDNFFITLAKQYGYKYTELVRDSSGKPTGGKILFDNDEMAGLMVKLNEYYKKGYLITGNVYGDGKHAYTSSLFLNKAALFTVSSTAGAKNTYTNLFRTVPLHLPHYVDEDNVAHRDIISQGPSVAILDHGNDEKALGAWLFLRFFFKEKNVLWSTSTSAGYLPTTKSGYASQTYKDISDPSAYEAGTLEYNLAVTYQYCAKVQGEQFISPVFAQSGPARTQAGFGLAQCLQVTNPTVSGLKLILAECRNRAETEK